MLNDMFVSGLCGLASIPFHPQWSRSLQYKNFKNRLIFGENMENDKVGHFLGHRVDPDASWITAKIKTFS